jgi:hypothetical protein
MANIDPPETAASPTRLLRLYHGTDQAGAEDLLLHGVDQAVAAVWNGSGEFWATTEPNRADWFARSHPSSPPAARFEFDLPDAALQAILNLVPPGAVRHGASDFEFLPASFALLNLSMTNRQFVPVP